MFLVCCGRNPRASSVQGIQKLYLPIFVAIKISFLQDLGPRLGWGAGTHAEEEEGEFSGPLGTAAGLGPAPSRNHSGGDRSPGWGRSSLSRKTPVQKAAPRGAWGMPGRAAP